MPINKGAQFIQDLGKSTASLAHRVRRLETMPHIGLSNSPIFYTDNYGLVGDGVTDNTAAFDALVADIVAGGIVGSTIQFGKGTYVGNFDLASLGPYWGFAIRGTGKYSTTLKASSGIVLDMMTSTYCVVDNLRILAAAGSEIGILTGRELGGDQSAGAFQTFRDILMDSYASVAGLFVIGTEVATIDTVAVRSYSSAPSLYVTGENVYGDNNLVYVGAHGTPGTTSQNILQIISGSFTKSGVSGPAVEIGPNVGNLHFTGVYFYAEDSDIIRFDNHALVSQWVNIVFNHCHWEGARIDAAILGKRTGSVGTPSIRGLRLKDSTFSYYRDPNDAGQADIDFSDTNYYLYESNIRNVNCYAGGGFKFGRIYDSYIEYKPYANSTTAAITAGATTFQVAADVITQGLIKANDFIVLGRGQQNNLDTAFTNPERRKVQSAVGTTVTVTPAFSYNHPTVGDSFWVGLPQIYVGEGCEIESFGTPEFTGVDSGNYITVHNPGVNTRFYYGPGPWQPTDKKSAVIINRPFYNAPGNPEVGMLAYADGTTWNPGGTGEGLYVYTTGGWEKLN